MNPAFKAIACAISATTVSAPCWAVVESAVRIDTVRIELIDLEPDDGIVPSLTFSPSPRSASRVSGRTDIAFDASGAGPLGPVKRSVSDPVMLLTAGAEVSGNGSFLGLALSAFGAVETGHALLYSAQAETGAASFVLSPHTLATFSASVSMETHSDGGRNSAYMRFELTGPGPGGTGSQLRRVERSMESTQAQAHKSEDFSVRMPFANLSDHTLTGRLYARADVTGYSFGEMLPAVPEPATQALTLLGLAGVCTLARRRARPNPGPV